MGVGEGRNRFRISSISPHLYKSSTQLSSQQSRHGSELIRWQKKVPSLPVPACLKRGLVTVNGTVSEVDVQLGSQFCHLLAVDLGYFTP